MVHLTLFPIRSGATKRRRHESTSRLLSAPALPSRDLPTPCSPHRVSSPLQRSAGGGWQRSFAAWRRQGVMGLKLARLENPPGMLCLGQWPSTKPTSAWPNGPSCRAWPGLIGPCFYWARVGNPYTRYRWKVAYRYASVREEGLGISFIFLCASMLVFIYA
jgi:hypothetical protein